MPTAHKALVEAAIKAREQASALFSNFPVGAALEASDGRVYTGCNIESASFGLTVCAERVAVFKALSEGARQFTRAAVVAGGSRPPSPCGACRQVLWEFCGDIELILANTDGLGESISLSELLPRPFDASFL